MNYTEEDLLPLSGLQHLLFCERQCALIHVEQAWFENVLTAEGRIMHQKVHESDREERGKIRVEYAMPLRSLKLGLVAKTDVVEFHRIEGEKREEWHPFPVEYKHGKPKKDNSDKVQLCAQAMCLEEMLGVEIKEGAIFYGKIRRRQDVVFDEALRAETMETARKFHELVGSGLTPKGEYKTRCKNCSLMDLCLPKTTGKRRSIKGYLERAVKEE